MARFSRAAKIPACLTLAFLLSARSICSTGRCQPRLRRRTQRSRRLAPASKCRSRHRPEATSPCAPGLTCATQIARQRSPRAGDAGNRDVINKAASLARHKCAGPGRWPATREKSSPFLPRRSSSSTPRSLPAASRHREHRRRRLGRLAGKLFQPKRKNGLK